MLSQLHFTLQDIAKDKNVVIENDASFFRHDIIINFIAGVMLGWLMSFIGVINGTLEDSVTNVYGLMLLGGVILSGHAATTSPTTVMLLFDKVMKEITRYLIIPRNNIDKATATNTSQFSFFSKPITNKMPCDLQKETQANMNYR